MSRGLFTQTHCTVVLFDKSQTNSVTRQSCWIIDSNEGYFKGFKLEPSAVKCFYKTEKQNSDKCTKAIQVYTNKQLPGAELPACRTH